MSNTAAVPLRAGGTVDRSEYLYIERAEDADLLALLAEGRYANVLTSRQMGKSSLVVSTARKLQARKIDCVNIDIGELGSDENQADAYQGLLASICDQLAIELDLQEWLASTSGTPNQQFLRFFREIGSQLTRPVVIFLDEIDATLSIPYSDDLFIAIRTISNERAFHPGYGRFTFCLVGVASPSELVKNRRKTPYNIAVTLELRDFDGDRDDLTPLLAELHPDPETARRMLGRILYWTGGQPYLTMRFVLDLAGEGETDVDTYVARTYVTLQEVMNARGHFEQISGFIEERLSDALATFALYERILDGKKKVPDLPNRVHTQLKLSGLVKRDPDGNLIVRNPLYEALFDRRWIASSKPRRTLRRLRMYLAGAAALGLLVIGTVTQSARIEFRKAQSDLATLSQTADPVLAESAYSDLARDNSGLMASLVHRRYEARVREAYAGFTARRAAALEKRAAAERVRGAYDAALLYGATAAVVLGKPPSAETKQLYDQLGLDRLRATLRGPSVLSGGIAVSRDGRFIAVGNTVWSASDGRVAYELPNRSVNTVAFDEQGLLYTGDDNGASKRWDGRKQKDFNVDLPAASSAVTAIAVSADGTMIGVTSADSPEALLYSTTTPRVITLPHQQEVSAIRFSANGTAVTASYRTVRLWSWSGKAIGRPMQHRDAVRAVALSPDGRLVATAAGPVLTIWSSGGVKLAERSEPSRIDDVAISDDGEEIAIVSAKGLDRYRADLSPLERIAVDKPIGVAYAPDRSWIVTRSVTAARIWSTNPSVAAPRARTPAELLADWQRRLGLVVAPDDQGVIARR